VIIRIGMRCGYEGGWATFLGIGLALLDGYHSPRGAAPTGQRRLVDWCRSPASGRSFGYGLGIAGRPPFAAGRSSYRESVDWRIRVGAPPRGEASGYGLGIAGWPPFAAGRSSYKGSVVLRFGVGAPPRGEAFVYGLGIARWPPFAAGRGSYKGGVIGNAETKKATRRSPFFDELPELSSGFPSGHGSDHQWWSGRCFQRLACYAVPSSRLSRLQRLST